MPAERKYEAEDSSLKYHDDASQAHDVEKNPSNPNPGVIEPSNPASRRDDKNIAQTESDSGVSTIHAEDDKDDYPEGGRKAWLVVIGSFCGSFSVFGLLNSTGVLLQYLSANQLKDYSPSQIGWIFGLCLFLTFFCGAPIGPIFDAYGPRVLIFCGSVLSILSMMLLGLCTKYWHFFIVYSILQGFGGALVNTPCIASIGHYFLEKRGLATGIAMTSGSIGGIIFPLMFQKLFPTVGFAWATRIVGFILAFMLVIANLLVRSRLPQKPFSNFATSILPDLTLFKDPPFLLITIGIFLLEWGIFVPLTYVTDYAISNGQTVAFGYDVIAILNAGSFCGRFGAGYVSDRVGRMNTLILSITLCVVACLALWLPGGKSTAGVTIFALAFGVVSGCNLSLSPVCVGQFCKTENYGRYFSSCWMVVAFGTLSGLPIAGEILVLCKGNYTGVIVFSGLSYALAGICLVIARVMKVGWKVNCIY